MFEVQEFEKLTKWKMKDQIIEEYESLMQLRTTTIVWFGSVFKYHTIINAVLDVQHYYLFLISNSVSHNVSTCSLQLCAPPLVYEPECYQKMCNRSPRCGKEEAESFGYNWEGYWWCGCNGASSWRSVLCIHRWFD